MEKCDRESAHDGHGLTQTGFIICLMLHAIAMTHNKLAKPWLRIWRLLCRVRFRANM